MKVNEPKTGKSIGIKNVLYFGHFTPDFGATKQNYSYRNLLYGYIKVHLVHSWILRSIIKAN
jgi:hypothetical protein